MRERAEWLAAVLTPLAAFVFLTRAVLGRIDEEFVGVEHVDHYGTQWFYWYAKEVLAGRQDIDHATLLFAPYGKDIYGHTGANLLDAFLSVPFTALFGQVLGYNLFVLGGMLATAALGGRLFFRLQGDRLGAGVVATLTLLGPWPLTELAEGRPTQAILLLPLGFLGALMALTQQARQDSSRKGWMLAMAAGVLLALTGYQYWYYALFCGLAAFAFGLGGLAQGPHRLRLLGQLALAAGVALVLALPAAIPMLQATDTGQVAGLLHTQVWSNRYTPLITNEGTLIGLYTWQPLARTAGFFFSNSEGQDMFLARTPLMPLVTLPVVGLALWRPGKLPRWALLASCLVLVPIAIGPSLLYDGAVLPNPPYIWLAKQLGLVQRLWWPVRSTAWFALVLPMAGGLAVAASTWRWWARWVAAALIPLAWIGELHLLGLTSLTSWAPDVPAGYVCLAEGPSGGVAELPYHQARVHIFYQTRHGRPMLGGMLEDQWVFTPQGTRDLLRDNLAAKALAEPPLWGQTPAGGFAPDLQELQALGFRYFVLQKDQIAQDMEPRLAEMRLRKLESQLSVHLGSPVYSDARVALFAPYGDTAPCDVSALERDRERRGRREVDPIRDKSNEVRGLQTVVRIWVIPNNKEGTSRLIKDLRRKAGLPANVE